MRNESYVYFALQGEDFEPNEVTKRLKIEPTGSWKKGDKSQYFLNQKFSCWKWSTEKGKEKVFIDKLVSEVIEKADSSHKCNFVR